MTRLSSTSAVANRIPPRYPQCRKRTIHINIARINNERVEVILWGDQFPDPDRDFGFRGQPDLKQEELKAAIDRLRDRWRENVIDHRGAGAGAPIFPYADRLDQSADPGMWESVGLELARAGRQVFTLLFENGDSGLQTVGRLLADALHADEQIIRVQSDDLFVPWSMLYTPPDPTVNLEAVGAPWSPDCFWGYRHLVEHTISQAPGFDARIRPTGDRLITGMIIDRGLDTQFPKQRCIAPLVEFFEGRTTVVFRESREVLATHLSQREVADQISYFCCHASFNGLQQAELTLGDGIRIITLDFQEWLANRTLESGPIVFVNGCQGGKLASLFYTSFGKVLLEAGANCLIGPQIEVSPLFAREYALEFFRRFLAGARIGDVAHDLAREFIDTLKNPLGLVVSLYRGLDTHIDPASLQ
jgi:hypothetical protein